jgi:hypothetical protein
MERELYLTVNLYLLHRLIPHTQYILIEFISIIMTVSSRKEVFRNKKSKALTWFMTSMCLKVSSLE